MNIQSAAATDIGRRRTGNEDAYFIDEALGLYIVCDGMGGHAAGEIASQRSIRFATQYMREHKAVLENASASPGGYFRVVDVVEKAIRHACARLHALACSDSAYHGMGTTMSLLLVMDGKAIMGHVGDSRLYVLRGGQVHQLSTDHTLANELFVAGALSAEEVANGDYNHVLTRSIGTQEAVEVETLLFDLLPNDVCLLCSDGLSNYFADNKQIVECIDTASVEQSARSLVAFANAEGGSDNITAIVVKIPGDAVEDDEAEKVQRQLAALRSNFLCRDLSEGRVMRLLNVSSVVVCPSGQNLVSRGDPDSGLYIVLQGLLSVQMANGTTNQLTKHDFFGHSSLVGDGTALASADVVQDAELLHIPRKEFQRLTQRLPKLGRRLLSSVADELCQNLQEAWAKTDIDLSDTGEWEPDELT